MLYRHDRAIQGASLPALDGEADLRRCPPRSAREKATRCMDDPENQTARATVRPAGDCGWLGQAPRIRDLRRG